VSDSGLDALAAEQAVEAKLIEAGADQLRKPFGEAPEDSAPNTGTPERNELDQFTSTDQPDATPPENVIEEIAADTPQDPAVAAFLAKYGGDPQKALEGAVHLQRKAGAQSNELGELRQMVEQLTSLQTQALQQANQPQPQQIDQATVDWFDQTVMENPQQALEYARSQGNQMLVQRGLSVWKDIDPYEAAVYTNRLENKALVEQMQQQLTAQAKLPLDATMNLALQNVRNRNPQFANYDDALETTLAKHGFAAKALEQAAASGDPAQIEGAIETLYNLAVGDTLQSLALTPTPSDTTQVMQDVVTPSTSETRDPAPEPSNTDRFREAFRQEADRARRGVWVAE
jgi:hypothetical protein